MAHQLNLDIDTDGILDTIQDAISKTTTYAMTFQQNRVSIGSKRIKNSIFVEFSTQYSDEIVDPTLFDNSNIVIDEPYVSEIAIDDVYGFFEKALDRSSF